eukprot:scpid86256/ scgid33927/ 
MSTLDVVLVVESQVPVPSGVLCTLYYLWHVSALTLIRLRVQTHTGLCKLCGMYCCLDSLATNWFGHGSTEPQGDLLVIGVRQFCAVKAKGFPYPSSLQVVDKHTYSGLRRMPSPLLLVLIAAIRASALVESPPEWQHV